VANRDPALDGPIDLAIGGDTRVLYDRLTRGSGLPGIRVNDALGRAFADACAARGARADRLIALMAGYDADEAPGATPLEFLPFCGIAAAAARACTDEAAVEPTLVLLHEHADDFRFRVRDAVVAGLVRIGGKRGDDLAMRVAPWMDGYHHAAAVLYAMAEQEWCASLTSADEPLARVDEAWVLARDASRAAARYPGHKSLMDALAIAPRALAARFGVPVFDMLVRWTQSKDPAMRAVIEKNLGGSRLAGRFAPELDRVRAAIRGTTAPPRNPDHYVGPTRGRGRKRTR
jgi:hypothetical protein